MRISVKLVDIEDAVYRIAYTPDGYPHRLPCPPTGPREIQYKHIAPQYARIGRLYHYAGRDRLRDRDRKIRHRAKNKLEERTANGSRKVGRG